MTRLPYLRMWITDWIADTGHLSLPHEGAYWRLIHKMWITPGCRVPNDVGWLMAHLHLTKDEYREFLEPVIKEFCAVVDGYVVQHRLQKEYEEATKKREKLKAFAKARWRKQKQVEKSMEALANISNAKQDNNL